MADQILESEGQELLAFEDLDLDNDMRELGRVTGTGFLSSLAGEVLEALGDLGPESRGLQSLSPELEPGEAQVFLRLVAMNLAFRLRSDALLTLLAAHTAKGPPPRLAPQVLGALFARARSERAARALLEASPLAGDAREAALSAASAQASEHTLPLDGAWLHVHADDELLDKAIVRALAPKTLMPWTRAVTTPGAQRMLALRRRGGWRTILSEDDRVDPALGKALIQAKVARAVWASFGSAGLGLQVYEGTRCVLDLERVEARIGAPPTVDDVAGELRALGILDLDPDHPRGAVALRFAVNVEACLGKRNARAWAFAD